MATEQMENAVEERPPPRKAAGAWSTLGVLQNQEFALFWTCNTISLIGMWMQGFAQGLVVTSLTTSAFALGLVNFYSAIPTLALTPYGGVLADRVDRRRIL